MFFNVKIKKWEQKPFYYASISISDATNDLEYLIKSKTKNEFNKKINVILKNCLLLKN